MNIQQQQRLEQIRKWRNDLATITVGEKHWIDTIDLLLSLVKSQEKPGVTVSTLIGYEAGLEEGATSMRSACVEKVKSITDEVLKEFAAEIKSDGSSSFGVLKRVAVIKLLRRLIPELESVSIQEQEK